MSLHRLRSMGNICPHEAQDRSSRRPYRYSRVATNAKSGPEPKRAQGLDSKTDIRWVITEFKRSRDKKLLFGYRNLMKTFTLPFLNGDRNFILKVYGRYRLAAAGVNHFKAEVAAFQEFKAVASAHHIASMIDHVTLDDGHYILLDVPGPGLTYDEWLDSIYEKRVFPAAQYKRFIETLVDALETFHERGWERDTLWFEDMWIQPATGEVTLVDLRAKPHFTPMYSARHLADIQISSDLSRVFFGDDEGKMKFIATLSPAVRTYFTQGGTVKSLLFASDSEIKGDVDVGVDVQKKEEVVEPIITIQDIIQEWKKNPEAKPMLATRISRMYPVTDPSSKKNFALQVYRAEDPASTIYSFQDEIAAWREFSADYKSHGHARFMDSLDQHQSRYILIECPARYQSLATFENRIPEPILKTFCTTLVHAVTVFHDRGWAHNSLFDDRGILLNPETGAVTLVMFSEVLPIGRNLHRGLGTSDASEDRGNVDYCLLNILDVTFKGREADRRAFLDSLPSEVKLFLQRPKGFLFKGPERKVESKSKMEDEFTEDDDLKSISINDKEYQIQELLGQGNYGKVYRVTSVDSKQSFALKVIVRGASGRSVDNVPEVLVLRAMQKHCNDKSGDGNVLCFVDAKKGKGRIYILTEYLQGYVTLRELGQQILSQEQKVQLSIPQIRQLIVDMCRALHTIEASGFHHNDFTDHNIMIRPSDLHIKAIDFGLAAKLDPSERNPDRFTLSSAILTWIGVWLGKSRVNQLESLIQNLPRSVIEMLHWEDASAIVQTAQKQVLYPH